MIPARIRAKREYDRLLIEAGKISAERRRAVWAELDRTDLFFLLVNTLHRTDADKDFVFDRCREVSARSNGVLDLWFREGYKSTIKSFAKPIQHTLRNPEETMVILSYNRPTAKAFMRQIKFEYETNETLRWAHPEIVWDNPRKDAPKWSEDEGIILKRKGNPKECTLEAWGLIDGMPTGRHFFRRIYEDVVTRDTVQSTGMMEKVDESFALSIALGTTPGEAEYTGTRYHANDSYGKMIERGIVVPRIYVPTKDGLETGEPWIWTREELAEKVRNMGPYVAACQLWQNPLQDRMQGFRREWLRFWKADRFNGLNIYILCDPANEKKKENDYTVFCVVGLGSDRNYYVLDIVRDRMNLQERANVLFKLHQQYRTRLPVGYERYGMQSDIEYMKERMERDNYRFAIIDLGGSMPKNDRIKTLVPVFSEGRVYLPETCVHQQYDGSMIDTAKAFVNEEYMQFPFPQHDDMLDCFARIRDPKLAAMFPQGKEIDPLNIERPPEQEYDPLRYGLGDR